MLAVCHASRCSDCESEGDIRHFVPPYINLNTKYRRQLLTLITLAHAGLSKARYVMEIILM